MAKFTSKYSFNAKGVLRIEDDILKIESTET